MDEGKKTMTQAQIDIAVDRALAKARERKSPVYSTPGSIRQGEEIMAQARIDAAHKLAERIKCGDFIPLDQLQAVWPGKRAAINKAVAAGRLFTVVGPSRQNYYPAFYSDPSLNRGALERVSETLGSLPAAVKYHFFITKFASLGETPLEALRKGRTEQVLVVATGYVEI